MKLAYPSFYTVVAAHSRALLGARFRLSDILRRYKTVFPGWVVLGLLSVSIGISGIEMFTLLFEHRPEHVVRLHELLKPSTEIIPFPIPALLPILLYILLALVQPRLFPWPRRRVLYLLTIFILTSLAGLFGPPPLRVFGYIGAYGVTAHARVALGRLGSWLVGALVVFAFLLDTLLMNWLAIGAKPPTTLLQLSIWLVGLLFIYAFTELGTQERAARLRGEKLVAELTQAHEQLRAYAVRAEELATMRERTRMAREIHDTLAQGLAAIAMNLETGCAVFSEQPTLARQYMERARKLAGEHLAGARNSILQLRSDVLDARSLPVALASLTAAWKPWEGAIEGHATFRANDIPNEARFAPAVELACYRIAQEALSNAARHGHARHADVELSIEADGLCLTVTDDGIGFDTTATSSSDGKGGFGIIGMRERVRLLNGRLEVISAPGAGTQVFAIIPLGIVAENPEPALRR